jgi:hypothetical protein
MNMDKSAFAESFAETILHGHIYYVEDDALKPYPWPKELTKLHLRPFMRRLQTNTDRFDVRRPSVKLDQVDGLAELGEIATYTWSVAEPALNHTLILRFSYAGLYTGEVQQEIWRHLGPQNVHLNVRKVFDDTRDVYQSILDTIQSSDPTPRQVDRALSTLFELNRRDPKPYYFTDAVLLFKKIVRHEFTLNTRNLRNAMYLDYQQGFDELSDLDKGSVFYDLAYIFDRVNKPGKYVGPDFTYGDIALHYYRKADEVRRKSQARLPAQLTVKILQGKSLLECELGHLNDCIRTTQALFDSDIKFRKKVYISFYTNVAAAIALESGYGESEFSTDTQFAAAMATSSEWQPLWTDLYCLSIHTDRIHESLVSVEHSARIVEISTYIAEETQRSCQNRSDGDGSL